MLPQLFAGDARAPGWGNKKAGVCDAEAGRKERGETQFSGSFSMAGSMTPMAPVPTCCTKST